MSPFDTAVFAAPISFIIAILLGLSGMAETVVTCLARFSLVQAIIAAEAGLMKGMDGRDFAYERSSGSYRLYGRRRRWAATGVIVGIFAIIERAVWRRFTDTKQDGATSRIECAIRLYR
jgi:hypothetical protein